MHNVDSIFHSAFKEIYRIFKANIELGKCIKFFFTLRSFQSRLLFQMQQKLQMTL